MSEKGYSQSVCPRMLVNRIHGPRVFSSDMSRLTENRHHRRYKQWRGESS